MNRISCLIALLAGLVAGLTCAQAQSVQAKPLPTKSDAASGDLAADIDALLAAQPNWTFSSAAEAGLGYNTNLLLSHANPVSSTFGRTSVEALLWHVPRGSFDYFTFLNGDYTRYRRPAEDYLHNKVDHEAEAFAGVELRYRRPDLVTLNVDAQGYYLDQVFDISDTDIQRVVSDLKVTGGKVGPTARLTLRSWLWIEGTGNFERQKYRGGVNDARIRDQAAKIGWEPSDRIQVTIDATVRRRDFDRRIQYKANGRPDDLGRLLVVHERELEGRLKTIWGTAKHWTATTRAGGLSYLDNGSKYLNYRQRHVAQELDWAAGKWTLHLEGEARRKEYELQTVPLLGTVQPQLIKDELTAGLRLERKLSDRWSVFTEENWERSRSNDPVASYRVNECLLGVRFSWEK